MPAVQTVVVAMVVVMEVESTVEMLVEITRAGAVFVTVVVDGV